MAMISAMVKQSCTSANWISAGLNAGHLVSLLGRGFHRAKRRDVVLLIQRDVVRRLRDAQHAHRLVGELRGALQRHDQHRGRAIADERAIVNRERLRDRLPASACSMVITLRMCASGFFAPF